MLPRCEGIHDACKYFWPSHRLPYYGLHPEWGARLNRYLLVALGGALGSVLRYFLTVTAVERLGIRFPYGTLAVNISACFALGLVMEYFNRHFGIGDAWKFLIPIGFIGGFSTFSTFEWEAWSSFTSGGFWIGMVYVISSVAGGLIAVAVGTGAARALP